MGRHPTGKTPLQPLLRVESKHEEMMRRKLAGESNRKIAHDLDMSESRVCIIMQSPLFIKRYKELEKEVKERFLDVTAKIQERVAQLQEPAIDFLGNLLKEKSINDMRVPLTLKHDAALDILELGGNGKKKVDNGNKNDAMADVIRMISEGFEVAKEVIKERNLSARNSEIPPEKAVNTISDIEFNDITNVDGGHSNEIVPSSTALATLQ